MAGQRWWLGSGGGGWAAVVMAGQRWWWLGSDSGGYCLGFIGWQSLFLVASGG